LVGLVWARVLCGCWVVLGVGAVGEFGVGPGALWMLGGNAMNRVFTGEQLYATCCSRGGAGRQSCW